MQAYKAVENMNKQSNIKAKMGVYSIYLGFLDCENREGRDIFGKYTTENVQNWKRRTCSDCKQCSEL